MDCFSSVRADIEAVEENCDVKGDPEKLVVRFYSHLDEAAIREFLAELEKTNEHMKGFEIKSIRPPAIAGDSSAPEGDTGQPQGQDGAESLPRP